MLGTAGAAERAGAASDRALDREIEEVARALREHGTCDRAELERILSARQWGPGRLRRAIRGAIDEGICERQGRRRYGPPRAGAPNPSR
jgi:hypothetical protein